LGALAAALRFHHRAQGVVIGCTTRRCQLGVYMYDRSSVAVQDSVFQDNVLANLCASASATPQGGGASMLSLRGCHLSAPLHNLVGMPPSRTPSSHPPPPAGGTTSGDTTNSEGHWLTQHRPANLGVFDSIFMPCHPLPHSATSTTLHDMHTRTPHVARTDGTLSDVVCLAVSDVVVRYVASLRVYMAWLHESVQHYTMKRGELQGLKARRDAILRAICHDHTDSYQHTPTNLHQEA